MSRIIRVVTIQNSLHQNKNREEVNNREIRHLPDLSIFNLHSVFVLVQRIFNHYPNYPSHILGKSKRLIDRNNTIDTLPTNRPAAHTNGQCHFRKIILFSIDVKIKTLK